MNIRYLDPDFKHHAYVPGAGYYSKNHRPMNYENLLLPERVASELAESLFAIRGNASHIPGEIDINYKITVSGEEAYIFKIARPGVEKDYVDFQLKIMAYAGGQGNSLCISHAIKGINGAFLQTFTDASGQERIVRMLQWIPGRPWHRVNPQSDGLRHSLGTHCGKLMKALLGFTHPMAQRDFPWDIAQGLWTTGHMSLFQGPERQLLEYYIALFESGFPAYANLRKAVVHNDANDHNILVSEDLLHPAVVAIIDFGDAIYTQIINDLAVACAYAAMAHPDPLMAILPIVKGYHEEFPLEERELEHLFTAIAMRLVISVTKSAINKAKEPANNYLLVSEKPAWELLRKWRTVHPEFALIGFRHACGLPPHPGSAAFHKWAAENFFGLDALFPGLGKNKICTVDISVGSTWIGHEQEFSDLNLLQYKIDKLLAEKPGSIPAGGYLEARPIYTSDEYGKIGNNGPETRTIHLGVDFWLPAGTAVHALFEGLVRIAVNDAGDKEYGGLVVLEHEEGKQVFYTLYGHLSVASATSHKAGDIIRAGGLIGRLGNYPENGNWAPHLHFQLMLSLFDYTVDFPGVAYHSQLALWKAVCPDPNLLFKSEALRPAAEKPDMELIRFRNEHLGKSLSLQYENPVKMVRGSGQYLLDQYGRRYLDTVNNVAHVGHEHPAVVQAGQRQMALLNTNTRYLHENINELAELLLATLPPQLSVVHFVNSGSEANELAIRMVKAATGQRDFIVTAAGYHGNSNMCVDISSYKFDGAGGQGAPEHTHVFPLPDGFRGKFRGEGCGEAYAGEVRAQLSRIKAKGRAIGAIFLESIISCGGQIELPPRFLPLAYEAVRAAGGLCIADEVQVGCGRVGKAFWGFELHEVIPDIVTIGKPLGNGHPLAAVVCTREVADKFANGMEYFNTFGGNPVSCAIGSEVLRTIAREGLQANARQTGNYLKEGLKALAKAFPIIGDVRGQGFFLGFELVDYGLNPMGDRASYLANRMKDYGILMSTDGPDNNVLKIKPPMVFNRQNADTLLLYLEKVLQENFMKDY